MIIYRFKIICTVRHALRTVNIKALLLHALRRTVVIKYMSLLSCEAPLLFRSSCDCTPERAVRFLDAGVLVISC